MQSQNSNQLEDLQKLHHRLSSLPALPVDRAAAILNINRRTVYRKMLLGELETVLRRGRKFVTARSISAYLKREYGSTAQFNAIDEVV